MRRMLLVLSLAGLTVLAGASEALAQRGGYGRGYGGGYGRGYGSGWYGRGYGYGGYGYGGYRYGGYGYGGYRYGGGWGYWPGISIGVGRGVYYSPYGYYGGLGYSSYYGGYGYGFVPNYYYAAPSYYVEPAIVLPTTQERPSFYVAPAAQQADAPQSDAPQSAAPQSAKVTVLAPAADAQLWFEDRATTQTGMERSFQSPPLEPNRNFTYTIKARWMENGQAFHQERRVTIQAGQSVTVDFRGTTRENLPPPLPRLPNAIPRQ